MPQLAALLSQIGPGPMVDKTGLTGVYDFDLELRKVPVSFFMFDSAQRPGEN
jgi:uncharacterized protein (TIGR03435 family)